MNKISGLKLTKIAKALIYSLPIVLFFSYYPIFPISSTKTMNIELSLPLIWLGIIPFFYLLELIINKKSQLLKIKYPFIKLDTVTEKTKSQINNTFMLDIKMLFLGIIYIIYTRLSVFWSPSPNRARLTYILILALFFATIFINKYRSLINTNKLIKTFLITALLVSVFCIIQSFADVMNFPRTQTLMCRGCTYAQFGFPRPTGFAIEPQFMGNLLLFPAIFTTYLLLFRIKLFHSRNILKLFMLDTIFISTIFLTFSRGAIFALLFSLPFLIFIIIKKNKKLLCHTTMLSTIIALSFTIGLITQIALGLISPIKQSPYITFAKVIHQNSLGKIDIRQPKTPSTTKEQSSADTLNNTTNIQQPSIKKPHFDGYVAESTDIRLRLSETAIKTWSQSPLTILFGVGIGGAGSAMYKINPSLGSPKEIVQNQFLETLLEQGVIGLLLLSTIIALYIIKIIQSKNNLFLISIILSFLFSVLFFSGLPNALHIYLLPVLFFQPNKKAIH